MPAVKACRLRAWSMRGSGLGMHPVVNIEDPVGKVVGRRKPSAKLVSCSKETDSNRQWAAMEFFPRIKPGVYRFKSHEEADQWLMDHMIRKPGN